MEFKWRMFYFSRNLVAFVLTLICSPIYWIWDTIIIGRGLFVTDGSEEIAFPWQWNWSWRDEEETLEGIDNKSVK